MKTIINKQKRAAVKWVIFGLALLLLFLAIGGVCELQAEAFQVVAWLAIGGGATAGRLARPVG